MHVVKRKGHKEKFDERKLYASVYAACLLVEMKTKECEQTASHVVKKIKSEIANKKEIDAKKLHSLCVKNLKSKNKKAAFMYDTHKDIS